jgi:hypothetical protein
LANPIVLQAIEQAWIDSQSPDPLLRHEEGGWIYVDTSTGQIAVRRHLSGGTSGINLKSPPIMPGSVIVGLFHTHPNPSDEGWEPGPSPQDELMDALLGVPDLIRADDGIHLSGPDSRRGGLAGGPGFPP